MNEEIEKIPFKKNVESNIVLFVNCSLRCDESEDLMIILSRISVQVKKRKWLFTVGLAGYCMLRCSCRFLSIK